MTSRSADELAAKFGSLQDELRGQSRVGVNKAAAALEDVFYQGALRSIRGPNIAGVKWGTSTKRATSTVNPQALVRYRGPVHWFEGGTKPHTIVSKKVGGSRKSRGQMSYRDGVSAGLLELGAVAFGGKVRWAVTHPGMRPRPFWERVKRDAPEVATRVYVAESVTKPIRRAGFGY